MTRRHPGQGAVGCYANPSNTLPHFSGPEAPDFYSHIGQFSLPASSFSSYSAPYMTSYSQHPEYMSESALNHTYHLASLQNASQASTNHFHFHSALEGRTLDHGFYRHMPIESQDSYNHESTASEPICPAPEGFPNVREFDQLMENYVKELSAKKRDKALIHARRARNIKMVLLDPKDTAVESAQFRFWVKKMFTLQLIENGTTHESEKIICHEGKPIAVKEKLFKILTRAHEQCQHGGRDKTSHQVRQRYSWIPKELISRFVKSCPTCQIRRGGGRSSPSHSRLSSPPSSINGSHTPSTLSPPQSRRDSIPERQLSRSHQNSTTHHLQESSLWMLPSSDWPNQSQYRPRIGSSPLDSGSTANGFDDMDRDAKPNTEYQPPNILQHRQY